ncbi:MAG: Gfo/Idh/MocA family oxidoreductase [Acutalibacteraceae bacterium]
MKTPVTFAIAGFGDRGSTYASMQALFPDRMQVVAVADVRPERVEKARALYNIPAERCFSSAEELLAQEKLADVLVVSTMDRQHVGHAIPALEKGYNILMESGLPGSAECRRIIEAHGTVRAKSLSATCCGTRRFTTR